MKNTDKGGRTVPVTRIIGIGRRSFGHRIIQSGVFAQFAAIVVFRLNGGNQWVSNARISRDVQPDRVGIMIGHCVQVVALCKFKALPLGVGQGPVLHIGADRSIGNQCRAKEQQQ